MSHVAIVFATILGFIAVGLPIGLGMFHEHRDAQDRHAAQERSQQRIVSDKETASSAR